jgi:predicted acetyltransferase
MHSEPLELRVIAESEIDQIFQLDEITFSSEPVPPEVQAIERGLLELDRSVGVFDGGTLAGVGLVQTLQMAVPGGLAPLAAVALIGVLPTHRRRGVMSSMIRHQLHSWHESGREAIAGLTASESPIYGRFGYGLASMETVFTVPRHRAGLRPVPGARDVALRLAPTSDPDCRRTCEEIYARRVGKRAGMLMRTEGWANAYSADPESWRGGKSALRTLLAERDGRAVGYARYRTSSTFDDSGVAAGGVFVGELHADDIAAYAALTGYLVDIDLTASTTFYRQTLDSPLAHLLTDLRAANVHVRDSLYLRLVDVDRALTARTYSTPIDVVIELTDELCPWNAGRWRLRGDEKTASCERTESAADLALDVRELASVYLGGTTLAGLAQTALVTELHPGAVAQASRAFSTDLEPWLPFGI